MHIRSIALAAGLLLSAGVSHASLVSNGGFESGLSGWSCVAPDGFCGTGTIYPPPEGAAHFFGYQNSDPQGVLSQALATAAGASYSISFMFSSSTDEPTNTLALTVGDLSDILDVAVGTWQSYSGVFTATAASTDLSFLFRTIGGSGTLQLDDVVVDRVGTVPAPATLTLALVALGLAAAARRKQA